MTYLVEPIGFLTICLGGAVPIDLAQGRVLFSTRGPGWSFPTRGLWNLHMFHAVFLIFIISMKFLQFILSKRGPYPLVLWEHHPLAMRLRRLGRRGDLPRALRGLHLGFDAVSPLTLMELLPYTMRAPMPWIMKAPVADKFGTSC